MTLIKPFRALRPQLDYAADVIAPPYDVVDREAAAALAQDKPHSFLHISKPEIDLPLTVASDDARIYEQALNQFKYMQQTGILQQDDTPGFYLYRLTQAGRQQLGVFVAIASSAYGDGRIKRHEFTKPEKENDRLRHLSRLHAHTSPVLLSYAARPNLTQLLTDLSQMTPPVYDILDHQEVRHELWPINDAAACETLQAALNAVPSYYVADGHHRSAAAYRYATAHAGEHYFLAALFASDQLHLLGYHRLITDLNGLSIDDLVASLAQSFDMTPSQLQAPTAANHFIVGLAHQAYALRLKPAIYDKLTAIERLDANIMFNYCLKPLLDITDPRRDPRLQYCGGQSAIKNIADALAAQQCAMAILMPPLAMADMIATADADQVLPPKSTWFEPKLADGLVCLLDDV